MKGKTFQLRAESLSSVQQWIISSLAVQSDGAADSCWLSVYADVRVWATVQTGPDLPISTDIRLIFTLIHSNCGACIEAKYYYHS